MTAPRSELRERHGTRLVLADGWFRGRDDVATNRPTCHDAAVGNNYTAVTGQYDRNARGGGGERRRACEEAWLIGAPRGPRMRPQPLPSPTPSMNHPQSTIDFRQQKI